MRQLINDTEINKLLFASGRQGFPKDDTDGIETLEFADTAGNPLLAQFYTHDDKAPNIIFFPSIETPLSQYQEMAAGYLSQGINILIVSYRGDNSEDHSTNLKTFYQDGRAIFDQAIAWLDSKGLEGARFIMGQDLGTTLAIDIVAETPDPVKGMFLESSICQTTNYLSNLGIPTDSMENLEDAGFGNIEKIEKIKVATLIFHGAKDTLVPIVDAESLQACSGARTKQFFIIPGAERDNLYQSGGNLYFETIKKFIDTVCGVNTWRQKRRKYQENKKK